MHSRSPGQLWRAAALGLLLCYPIMAVKWIPFGGGGRYLNVIAPPVCLALLWQARHGDIRNLLLSALRWGLPFLPFVLAWVFAQAWHGYDPMDLNPPMRLLWCSLLFVGARLAGVSYRHLSIAAGLGAAVYFGVALVEVYGLGRGRAWGGIYENRFGQFSIWVAGLCFLHVFNGSQEGLSRTLGVALLVAGVFGVISTVLSGSRGALMALLVVATIVLFKSGNWRRGLLAAAVLILAMVLFGFLYRPLYERLELAFGEGFAYFSEAEFSPSSIGIRLELFRITFLVLLDHPLIGPGYVSLKQLYEVHPGFGTPHPAMLDIPGFHNDWGEAVGIGGGILLCGLLATCIWLARVSANIYPLAFLGFAVIFGFSEIFFTNKMGLSLLMASWSLYAAAEQNQKQRI